MLRLRAVQPHRLSRDDSLEDLYHQVIMGDADLKLYMGRGIQSLMLLAHAYVHSSILLFRI
jgi:hypothetical protein